MTRLNTLFTIFLSLLHQAKPTEISGKENMRLHWQPATISHALTIRNYKLRTSFIQLEKFAAYNFHSFRTADDVSGKYTPHAPAQAYTSHEQIHFSNEHNFNDAQQ